MKTYLSGLMAIIGLSVATLAPAPASANYPDKPISLVVNYGAGGNTDVASRNLASGMEKHLKQPVVVVNRPGVLGTMGPAYTARQTPDGYTFGVVTYSTVAITPHLMDVPYTIDSFDFIAGFGRFRYGVAVRADSPYKTLDDLVSASKKDSGLFFGAPSAPNNLAMFELAKVTGGKFEQVLYKSGAETVNALLGKQVDVIVQNPSDILPHVQAGTMRLLASASPIRWPELPNVATMKEQGYNVEIDSWLGIAAPKGTPPERVKALEAAAIAAMNDPEVQTKFKAIGVDPATLTGAQYRKALEDGYKIMGEAIRAAKLPRITQ